MSTSQTVASKVVKKIAKAKVPIANQLKVNPELEKSGKKRSSNDDKDQKLSDEELLRTVGKDLDFAERASAENAPHVDLEDRKRYNRLVDNMKRDIVDEWWKYMQSAEPKEYMDFSKLVEDKGFPGNLDLWPRAALDGLEISRSLYNDRMVEMKSNML